MAKYNDEQRATIDNLSYLVVDGKEYEIVDEAAREDLESAQSAIGLLN
jgi:hypothetical protein